VCAFDENRDTCDDDCIEPEELALYTCSEGDEWVRDQDYDSCRADSCPDDEVENGSYCCRGMPDEDYCDYQAPEIDQYTCTADGRERDRDYDGCRADTCPEDAVESGSYCCEERPDEDLCEYT